MRPQVAVQYIPYLLDDDDDDVVEKVVTKWERIRLENKQMSNDEM